MLALGNDTMAFRQTWIAAAAALGLVLACGGGGEVDAPATQAELALEGQRVAGRDAALQIVARGVVAPLHFSGLAHALLVRLFERRSLEGPIAIEIETDDHAEGLMLRGEAGFVRARLRFEQVALGTGGRVDGEIVLEVSRAAAGAGLTRRSQADRLSVSDGRRTLHWSYLAIEVDAQQVVQTLTVVADTPIDGSEERTWIDVTASAPVANAPSRRYMASGVIGFLDARLVVDLAADGSLRVDVDNGKNDQVDFVVQASAPEARALMLGL